MNVNQSAPPVPPFGQPQPIYPGYHQPSYGQPIAAPPPPPPSYGAFNGPISGYQQTPLPGMTLSLCEEEAWIGGDTLI